MCGWAAADIGNEPVAGFGPQHVAVGGEAVDPAGDVAHEFGFAAPVPAEEVGWVIVDLP
jgi:hypothetical protein